MVAVSKKAIISSNILLSLYRSLWLPHCGLLLLMVTRYYRTKSSYCWFCKIFYLGIRHFHRPVCKVYVCHQIEQWTDLINTYCFAIIVARLSKNYHPCSTYWSSNKPFAKELFLRNNPLYLTLAIEYLFLIFLRLKEILSININHSFYPVFQHLNKAIPRF